MKILVLYPNLCYKRISMKKVKYSKKRWHIKDKLKTFQFAIFLLTIGFASGLFWPLFHVRELKNVTNQLQDRAEGIDNIMAKAMEAVRNGVFSPGTVSLLRKIGGKATNSLIAILRDESIPSLERQHAAVMLGLLKDGKAIPALVNGLEHCDDPSLKAHIACSLGRIGDESAIPHLTQLLTDSDDEVRLSAIEAMSRIGGIKAASIFIRALEDALKRMPEEVLLDIPEEDTEWWYYYSRIRKLGCHSIKGFQKAVGLKPDGVIGLRTKKAVDKVYKEKTGK